jgi:Transglutaminase-like superfamily
MQDDRPARSEERFDIAPDVHVCVTGTGSVILDLKRDKYLGLGREETELLVDAVLGWPRPVWQRSVCHDSNAASQATNNLCESLLTEGVLQRSVEPARPAAVPTLGDMKGEWVSIGDELEVRGTVKLRHIANFLAAYLWARYSLARRPFCMVVAEVRLQKRHIECVIDEQLILHVSGMVDVFRRLRPFVFAPEGHCLLHALTLVRFLSKYQLHPEWVIGVTTQPWGAHSWVQWGNYLLDSNPEKVCAYTPIMSV